MKALCAALGLAPNDLSSNPKPDGGSVGERISAIRMACNWSQDEMAGVCGLSVATIRKAERGERVATASLDKIFAKCGGKPVDFPKKDRSENHGQGGLGVQDGCGLPVGRSRDGKFLAAPNPFTGILIGPTGCGKTRGFVIPALLSMDGTPLVVHGRDSSAFDATAAHRVGLGKVFRLRWRRSDGGETGLSPRWNPLSVCARVSTGPRRNSRIESIVSTLIHDRTANEDRFWTSMARSTLIGLVGFAIAKVERLRDGDSGAWKGMPPRRRGMEASLPMILDMLDHAMDVFEDESNSSSSMLDLWLKEAREMDRRESGSMTRVVIELSRLAQCPPQTRRAVLLALGEALSTFCGEGVPRLNRSDFDFDDLLDRNAPTTVYLESRDEGGTDARLNSLFVETFMREIELRREEDGRDEPAVPVWILDDCAALPGIGRIGQKLSDGSFSCLLSSRDLDGLDKAMAPLGSSSFLAATNVKLIARPRSGQALMAAVRMAGGGRDGFPTQRSLAWMGRDEHWIVRHGDCVESISALTLRPEDEEFGSALLAASARPMTPDMPESFESEARRRDEEEAYFVGRLNSAATAMESPRRVVVVTPNDIEALMRDERGELPERGSVFACAEVFLQEGEVFIERPSLDDIFVTDVVEDVVAFVGGSRYVIFDELALENDINAVLRAAGKPCLDPEYAECLSTRAREVGENPGSDLCQLGFDGGAGLDLPESPEMITPQFAINFAVETLNFIMGIEEQKMLFEV